MNNLMKFENQKVEVFEFEEKILFNPYDVGRCLGLTDSAVRKSIRYFNENQRVKITKSDVTISNNLDIPTSGRVYLTESGVYKLIFKSRKREAERFCDWVTDEVLPSIRKTGKYQLETDIAIKRRLYNGEPVLLRRDLDGIFDISKDMINNVSWRNNIGVTIIAGKELDKFKQDNPDLKRISNARIYSKDDVEKLAKILKVKYDEEFVKNYFFEELSDYEKLWRVEFARDIENLTYRIDRKSPYRKMLFMVASKIYMDCGMLDRVYDNLEPSYLPGHKLTIENINFKNRLKEKLK